MPTSLIELARRNLREDYIRRWFCKKYRIPRTDPRYGEHIFEDLVVEFLEDAIERGDFAEGVEGNIVEKVELPDGTPIFKTGDPEIDAMEEEFAAKVLEEIAEERRVGKEQRHVTLFGDREDESGSAGVGSFDEDDLAVLGGRFGG